MWKWTGYPLTNAGDQSSHKLTPTLFAGLPYAGNRSFWLGLILRRVKCQTALDVTIIRLGQEYFREALDNLRSLHLPLFLPKKKQPPKDYYNFNSDHTTKLHRPCMIQSHENRSLWTNKVHWNIKNAFMNVIRDLKMNQISILNNP